MFIVILATWTWIQKGRNTTLTATNSWSVEMHFSHLHYRRLQESEYFIPRLPVQVLITKQGTAECDCMFFYVPVWLLLSWTCICCVDTVKMKRKKKMVQRKCKTSVLFQMTWAAVNAIETTAFTAARVKYCSRWMLTSESLLSLPALSRCEHERLHASSQQVQLWASFIQSMRGNMVLLARCRRSSTCCRVFSFFKEQNRLIELVVCVVSESRCHVSH